jgi:hypothetical protein
MVGGFMAVRQQGSGEATVIVCLCVLSRCLALLQVLRATPLLLLLLLLLLGQALGDHGFPVPVAIDNNRHAVLMELVDGQPLVQV